MALIKFYSKSISLMHTQFSWNLLSTPTVSPEPSASGLLGFVGTATSRWWGPANHTFWLRIQNSLHWKL